jgi:hypothetical protein
MGGLRIATRFQSMVVFGTQTALEKCALDRSEPVFSDGRRSEALKRASQAHHAVAMNAPFAGLDGSAVSTSKPVRIR